MKRTKHNIKDTTYPILIHHLDKDIKVNPDAILTSDWHIREDTPTCRVDDFYTTQWDKVQQIAELQKKFGCPVFHAGDLFHYWKPSPRLLSDCISHFPKNFHTIYGQHDLPQHNLDLAYKSGIYNLQKAGVVKVLNECSWGQEPEAGSYEKAYIDADDYQSPEPFTKLRKILVWHIFNYQGKELWPGCTSPKGAKLLRKYPKFDLILTGDNHKPFVETHENRLLVNPGSLMRQEAGQIDYEPRVYLYYAKDNSVVAHYMNIDNKAVSREHIEKVKERNERIDAFVSKLDGDWDAVLSFEENLKRFIETNQVRESVIEIIYDAVEIE